MSYHDRQQITTPQQTDRPLDLDPVDPQQTTTTQRTGQQTTTTQRTGQQTTSGQQTTTTQRTSQQQTTTTQQTSRQTTTTQQSATQSSQSTASEQLMTTEQQDTETKLTGKVEMTSSDNRVWRVIEFNRSELLTEVEEGMVVTLSDGRGFFIDKILQQVNLSTGLITLDVGVSNANFGDILNFQLDVSQTIENKVEDDVTEDTTILTGNIRMISDDSSAWMYVSGTANNGSLLQEVTKNMVVTISNPSDIGNQQNFTISSVNLSNGVINLNREVSGTNYGDVLNFSIDVSQIIEEVVEEVEEEVEEVEEEVTNPIVEVGLIATEEDGWYFADPNSDYLLPNLLNPYVGVYHLHEDGTAMIGEGILGIGHDMVPEEIIIQSLISEITADQVDSADVVEEVSYETIQAVKEIVSDVIYKKWFENNTLSDEQILSMQTTIRDGIRQTGRNEDEPLVFYKKDRNTLENREDLQGENFEQICQNIHENSIVDIESKFSLVLPDEIDYSNPYDSPLSPGEYFKLQQYVMRYNNDGLIIDVVIAEEAILYYDEALIQTQESGGS